MTRGILEGPTLAERPCCDCGKPPAFDDSDLTDGEHCRCCLGGDCSAPAVFVLDDAEHYCEQCGPAMVLRLIATPSTAPKHIDIVRLAVAA